MFADGVVFGDTDGRVEYQCRSEALRASRGNVKYNPIGFLMDELHTGHVASAEDHHLRPAWSASVKVVVAVRDALDDGSLADDVRVGRAANKWLSDDQFLAYRVCGQHCRWVSEISSEEVRLGRHPGGTLAGRAGPSSVDQGRFTACARQGSDFRE